MMPTQSPIATLHVDGSRVHTEFHIAIPNRAHIEVFERLQLRPDLKARMMARAWKAWDHISTTTQDEKPRPSVKVKLRYVIDQLVADESLTVRPASIGVPVAFRWRIPHPTERGSRIWTFGHHWSTGPADSEPLYRAPTEHTTALKFALEELKRLRGLWEDAIQCSLADRSPTEAEVIIERLLTLEKPHEEA